MKSICDEKKELLISLVLQRSMGFYHAVLIKIMN